MKIKLFSGSEEICTLRSLDDPPKISPRAAVSKILEYFRDGEWLWIDEDTCCIRYDAITKVAIVPEQIS